MRGLFSKVLFLGYATHHYQQVAQKELGWIEKKDTKY